MKLKDLSKHRYLYKFYINSLKEPHCEKFPIIYSNKKVVYINKHDNQGLLEIKADRIHDNLDDIQTLSEGRLNVGIYLWNEVDCTKVSGHELITQIKERNREARRKQLLHNIKYYQDKIGLKLSELEEKEK